LRLFGRRLAVAALVGALPLSPHHGAQVAWRKGQAIFPTRPRRMQSLRHLRPAHPASLAKVEPDEMAQSDAIESDLPGRSRQIASNGFCAL
jgi:hypothetical protein